MCSWWRISHIHSPFPFPFSSLLKQVLEGAKDRGGISPISLPGRERSRFLTFLLDFLTCRCFFALYSRAPARREAEALMGPMVDFQPLGKRSPAEGWKLKLSRHKIFHWMWRRLPAQTASTHLNKSTPRLLELHIDINSWWHIPPVGALRQGCHHQSYQHVTIRNSRTQELKGASHCQPAQCSVWDSAPSTGQFPAGPCKLLLATASISAMALA